MESRASSPGSPDRANALSQLRRYFVPGRINVRCAYSNSILYDGRNGLGFMLQRLYPDQPGRSSQIEPGIFPYGAFTLRSQGNLSLILDFLHFFDSRLTFFV